MITTAIFKIFSTCFFTGVRTDPVLRGVIPNSFEHIFTHIARTENQQYLVRASYLEIYRVHRLYFSSFVTVLDTL